MKPVVTLYCIADESGFRLLRGSGSRIEEVLNASAKAFEDVDYQFASSGRNRAGAGRTSFGHDTRTAAEIERPRLARHAVRALESDWAGGGADRIVLVAGPKMLGTLRDAMPASLGSHIAVELAKDLSGVPAHGLHEHLKDVTQL